MRLPHFLRKFAMTEGEEKQKEIQRMDSRFRGNDISGMRWDCRAPKAVLAMTEKE